MTASYRGLVYLAPLTHSVYPQVHILTAFTAYQLVPEYGGRFGFWLMFIEWGAGADGKCGGGCVPSMCWRDAPISASSYYTLP